VETWEAIRSRRNVRSFTDEPIPDDHLNEILEAGRRAPSSQNWQPWDLVVVTSRPRLAEISQVSSSGSSGYVAHAAAAVALVATVIGGGADSERRLRTLYYDLGQLTVTMMLAAAGLRIGSGHAGVADQDVARKVLGLPADKFCAYLIAFGYPADRPLDMIRHPNRRPLDEIVHRDHW
jgi:nitroreductase